MTAEKPRVLFVSTHNAARSQIDARIQAWLRAPESTGNVR